MEGTNALRDTIKLNVRTIATAAVLIALALVLSLVEQWIPLGFMVPGIRLGLANVATVFALYLLGPLPALVVLVLRCILGSMFSGTFTAFLFSLTGGLLAFLVMWLLSLSRYVSPLGVCVGGAGAHNIGQILMACLVLGSKAPFAYLPLLLLLSIVTGLITGLISCLVLSGLNGGYYISDRVQARRGFRPDPELFEETAPPASAPEPKPVPAAVREAVPIPAEEESPAPDRDYDDFINSEVWEYVNSEYEEKPLPAPEDIPLPQGDTYDEIMARIRADFEAADPSAANSPTASGDSTDSPLP